MRLVLPTCGSCGVEPMLGLALPRAFSTTGVVPTGVWR